MSDEDFMRLAIEQARMGLETLGCGEVGCVIVKDGVVVAEGYNEAECSHDPTAHAEIVTLRKLGKKLGAIEFPGHTLYCTLQCCGMCSRACAWAKIERIVYGATSADVSSRYFENLNRSGADGRRAGSGVLAVLRSEIDWISHEICHVSTRPARGRIMRIFMRG